MNQRPSLPLLKEKLEAAEVKAVKAWVSYIFKTLTDQEILDYKLLPTYGASPQNLNDTERLNDCRNQLYGDTNMPFSASLKVARRTKDFTNIARRYLELEDSLVQPLTGTNEDRYRPAIIAQTLGYSAFFKHLGLDPKAILAEKGLKI